MNVLTSDFETTRFPEGNPFSKHLKAVCLGFKFDNTPCQISFEMEGGDKYKKDHPNSSEWLNEFDLCIFFNAKFDLHWYRRLGFEMPKQIWCTQLAEFILSRQTWVMPSLNDVAKKYGFPLKHDVVEAEYWDKGIDTDSIPVPILSEYCKYDVDLTYNIYLEQQKEFTKYPGLYRLFKLACQDLLILQEMEWNGLKYDESLCLTGLEKCNEEIKTHLSILSNVYPHIPINFNSGDQLSAFLYGGIIYETIKQPIGTYKSGKQAGQIKYKNVEIEHQLPRMVEPLPKTELKKVGMYGTSEGILQKLKGKFASKYVPHLLELARLDKLKGTYYEGIPKQNHEMNWDSNMIHGQLNQCVAATGRLSASKPNQQNFAEEILNIFVSRYDS